MPPLNLFDNGAHRNILLEDLDGGLAVQSNQHLIIHGKSGLILDPGGHKVYNRVLSATMSLLRGGQLKYLFLSHQDPDIVAASNGWLMTTDADAYCSALWTRFIPHFGLDRLVENRLKGVSDEGMVLDLDGAQLIILPAHFLHSPGNLHLYDTTSKILYTGDLGAALGQEGREVLDFDAHLRFMEGFHRRYMASIARCGCGPRWRARSISRSSRRSMARCFAASRWSSDSSIGASSSSAAWIS
jgi:flavorubredoxin